MASFAALLAGYKNKIAPPPPAKPVEIRHPLYDRLVDIRNHPPQQQEAQHSGVCNLGILFIIIDDFPNEPLWRLWLEQGGVSVTSAPSTESVVDPEGSSTASSTTELAVRCWFHAKNPSNVRSAWVRERLVTSFHLRPEWGSIELTKVMAHMLHEATTVAPHINKFCFASESCIPIVPLRLALHRMYHNNSASPRTAAAPAQRRNGVASITAMDFTSSWVCHTDQANNGYARALQFDSLERDLPPGCVHKASQWLLLSRTHAMAVLSLLQRFNRREARSTNEAVPPLGQDLFPLFDVKGASDEMFFPCCLAVLGYINPPSSPAALGGSAAAGNGAGMAQVIKKQITYADWRGQANNPIRYTTFPTALAQKITAAGVPGAATTAASAGSKRRHHSSSSSAGIADDDGEAPEVDSTQQSAVFLRKIQFPAAPAAGASACTEAQRLFLQDWLRCLLAQQQKSGPAEMGSGQAVSAAGPTETAAVTAAVEDGEGCTADGSAGGVEAGAAGAQDATAAPSAVQQPDEEAVRWLERALQLCEEVQRCRR